MRKLTPLFLMLLPVFAVAQKNAVKVNLSSLGFRNYHIQYERKLVSKLTLNLGVRYMPNGGLPLENFVKSTFPSVFDDPNLEIGKFTMGGTAFTLEPRLYLSKKAMKGFYIAPYARYSTFDLGLPLKYSYSQTVSGTTYTYNKTGVFNGTIKSFSGGLMFGTQFSIAKKIALDIWWIGGHYGSSNGDLVLNTTLPSQEERDGLQLAINNIKDDLGPFKIEQVGAVTSSGAKLKSDGPWAGIRALGINIGIKF